MAKVLKHHPTQPVAGEVVLSTGETVQEFEGRLKKEGRFTEYRRVLGEMVKAERVRFHTIRKREAGNWRPLRWNGGEDEKKSSTTWESVRWAVEALGLHETGVPVGMHQAPSKESWSLFNWGRRAPEKLYSLWVNLGLKRDTDHDGDRKTKLQVEEINQMLAELLDDKLLRVMRDADGE